MVSAPSIGGAAVANKSANRASNATSTTNRHTNCTSTPSKTSSQYTDYAPHISVSMRRAPPLDMATVEVRGTKTAVKDTVRAGRPHGLREAPTFCPTEQEWQDPMEYMRTIAPEGRKYGICKIVPPESWNPTFAIDTEKFHFRTCRQELNSVEGSTRTNLKYLDELAKFHKSNGMNLNRFPSAGKRPLDLYKLKKAVESRGGFESVCRSKKWAEIGRDLGYSGKIMSSLSSSLKNSYQKWLQPYEDLFSEAKSQVQQDLELENGKSYNTSPTQSSVKESGPFRGPPTDASLAPLISINGNNSSVNDINGGGIMSKVEDVNFTRVTPTYVPAPIASGFTPGNVPRSPSRNGKPLLAGGFTPINLTPATFQSVKTSQPLRWDLTNGTVAPATNTKRSTLPETVDGKTLKRAISHEQLDDFEFSKNGDISASRRSSKRMRSDGGNPTRLLRPLAPPRISGNAKPTPKFLEGESRCEGCGFKEEPSALAICDGWDNSWPKACPDIPSGTNTTGWHCPRCLIGTGQSGREEGSICSLKQFQERANNFKCTYFEPKRRWDSALNRKGPVTEDDVEKEFWRLVESRTETVEVEYGADIHSATAGSGFPDAQKQPLDPYSTDPWNLNILPLVPESLFPKIKSDISCMTVPRLYVGMCFSTFCWHNKDHYTYSANYQHFGDTKTWYGIPGEDAEHFEKAMREAVPELFEQQPDLLFQLVTLLPPKQLRKAGASAYALDQRAGQMVITFPQAYHAGFNHGFNFNEAVSFAPSDWEPFGQAGVERLREFRRQPCFSHDELLMAVASQDMSIRSAMWLWPALERMKARELCERSAFIQRHKDLAPCSAAGSEMSHDCRLYREPPRPVSDDGVCVIGYHRDEGKLGEDEYNCSHCRAYCYLSRYVCKNMNKVFCLLHAGQSACCEESEAERYAGKNHHVYYRVGHDEIDEIVDKVGSRARIPHTWQEKLDEELNDKPRPSLKRVKTLMNEGERINWDLPGLPDLKVYVDKCEKWVEEATNFTARKQQNQRKNERAWRRDKAESKNSDAEEKEKEFRGIENLHKLLADAEKLSFDDDALSRLRERAQEVTDFQQQARSALQQPTMRLTDDLETLVEDGKGFNLELPEIAMLEKVIKQLKWYDKAREMQRSMQDVGGLTRLIEEGRALGLPDTDKYLVFFQKQRSRGEQWETKARELIRAEPVHYQQLEALVSQAVDLPVSLDIRSEVKSILAKQKEAYAAVKSLYDSSQEEDFHKRPKYIVARDTLASVARISKSLDTAGLEKEVRRHEDWMRRGKKLFGKSNAPLHILKSHMEGVRGHNDFCLDLRDTPRMPVEPASREATPTSENGDAQENASTRDVFCLCRQPEAGMMIECELCREWYHSKCLKIARGRIKTEDKYICPVCDWRVKIPRDAARPKLEDLQNWQSEIPDLPFQPEEEDVLEDIISKATEFRKVLRPVFSSMTSSPDEVWTQRFYLRKIEGAEILLAQETNFLRQELHKWGPVAPDPPPMIEVSLSTRKPRPTKMQKLMQTPGINNPDDLSQRFCTKPHASKTKHDSPKPNTPQSDSVNSNGGRNPVFCAFGSASGNMTHSYAGSDAIEQAFTAALSDISNPSLIYRNSRDAPGGLDDLSELHSQGVPHSPIFRPATPHASILRAGVSEPPVDPSLFSPGATSHFGVSDPGLCGGLPTNDFDPQVSRMVGLPGTRYSHTKSGGGSCSNIGNLFADFINDDVDRYEAGGGDSSNQAGEEIETLGFVNVTANGRGDGVNSDGQRGFLEYTYR